MTKVEAIERVLKQNGGSANLNTIYEKIQKFYPKAKKALNGKLEFAEFFTENLKKEIDLRK